MIRCDDLTRNLHLIAGKRRRYAVLVDRFEPLGVIATSEHHARTLAAEHQQNRGLPGRIYLITLACYVAGNTPLGVLIPKQGNRPQHGARGGRDGAATQGRRRSRKDNAA